MSYRILDFEREADPDGQWIPLAVRMKLDLAGLKVGLRQWQALAPPARRQLVEAPADSDHDVETFARRLADALAAAGASSPEPMSEARRSAVFAWKDAQPATDRIATLLADLGYRDQWQRLDRFGRYLVYTLASKQDGARLAVALREIELEHRRPH